MFDNIIIKKQLPLNKTHQKLFSNINWSEQEFQTKDMENCLIKYILDENGKFYEEIVKGKNVRVISEEEEEKLKKQKKFCWPYEFKVESVRKKFLKITKEILFYEIIKDKNGNEWWIDFKMTLVDGKLKNKIKIEKLYIHRTKRKILDDEKNYQNWYNERNNKFHIKIRKFLNKITFNKWFDFVKKMLCFIRFCEKMLQNFGNWIIKYIL